MASINCRCGTVSLGLNSSTPKSAFDCCCVDCFAKNKWSCEAAGVPMPAAFQEYGKQPVHLAYFDNQLKVLKGRENLAFNKVREKTTTTNMIASCCKSILCASSSTYKGQTLLVFPDFCPLVGADLQEPKARTHIKDFSDAAIAALPPKPGIWIELKKTPPFFEFKGDLAGAVPFMRAVGAPMKKDDAFRGESFEELLAAAGGKEKVVNLGMPQGGSNCKKE